MTLSTYPSESGNPDERTRVRALVLEYGWNSVSYQILNPGFTYWFSHQEDAVIGYWRDTRSRVRVVGGAPVCSRARLPEVVREWEEDARRNGDSVCYLCAADRLLGLFRSDAAAATPSPQHATVALGAQPVWNPAHWPEILAGQSSLRQQIHRARNKGVQVEEWPSERAGASRELRQCLNGWLAARPMPPLRFLAEPNTLDHLHGRRVFVAMQHAKRKDTTAPPVIVGFLVASPIPRRKGFLFEQVIRCQGAANGVSESLIDTAMRAVASDGARYVTLGLVPLSRRCPETLLQRNPSWLRLLLDWARAHGRRFWNFDGLDAFKAKFQPDDWEPIFAISSQPHFTPGVLMAIARAFSPEAARLSSGQALFRLFSDAVRQEWKLLSTRHSGRAVPQKGGSAPPAKGAPVRPAEKTSSSPPGRLLSDRQIR